MRGDAFVIFNSIYFTQYAAILRNPTASTVRNHTKSGAVVFDSFPELCTKWIRIRCWSAKSPLPCPVVGLTPLRPLLPPRSDRFLRPVETFARVFLSTPRTNRYGIHYSSIGRGLLSLCPFLHTPARFASRKQPYEGIKRCSIYLISLPVFGSLVYFPICSHTSSAKAAVIQ